MTRILAVAAAAAATLALTPAAGIAQTSNGYYTAVAATAPAKNSFVTRSTVWRCGEGTCVAAKATSRDAIMCELVAGEVGKLSSFAVRGEAFSAEALEKCNARAK
ncbi:hypothetical protein P1X14_17195 [Sphingomonas sp. AOB5]|uniref:CC_3452 family protein n=1 Tax=Sphingomonas sp. AOB5 TaxID=3034017 RepID=UPI0023F6E03A|nr:hypothetical protein [Sphingomonas sp. AOB5]MDF7776996.1 hypothetical protein [Sphingomonas sp. AOB5]